MYATFDRHSPASLNADVLSLSWKGDARQGWLAAGNSRKTVGVTYTEAKDWEDEPSSPTEPGGSEVALERQGMRRNFNFREHSSEVSLHTHYYTEFAPYQVRGAQTAPLYY